MNNSSLRILYSRYVSGAKQRDLMFDLSIDEFRKLITQDCFYCQSPPSAKINRWNSKLEEIETFLWNGIDRLDSNDGYIPENSVPCCRTCNIMKMDTTLEDFFIHISRIYHTHINKQEK